VEDSLLRWIVLLPFLGFAVNLFLGRFLPRLMVGVIACGTVAGSCLLSLFTFIKVANAHSPTTGSLFPWDWISIAGKNGFTIDWGLQADALTTVMLLVVTFVGFFIHLYSYGYMHEEKRFSRYFSFLNLFSGFMLLLVLAKNLLGMFVGWEGVGLCSYLLIGFWFDDKAKGESNSAAGMKAFVVNRIGDWGFTVGMLLLFVTLGTTFGIWTLDIPTIRETVTANADQFKGPLAGTLLAVTIMLFVGATGKSAQIPLFVWLPDAMAGPTPVSALIHAATMVTAGVYMVCRMGFLYHLSVGGSAVVAVIGGLTAIFAATIAFAQYDIKKVLAYSTVSQLGFMFLAAGVGAYAIAIFHVVTHACFKACLFLGSGSVIHGCGGEQDMRKMGGLRKYMPITFWTFVIATGALAGLPPLAGFFSKDEILLSAATTHQIPLWLGRSLWVVGSLAALGTAFYMTRCVMMTFGGEYRGGLESSGHGHGHDDPQSHGHGHGHGEPHESPWTMYVPLIALGILSIAVGFLGTPWKPWFTDFLHSSFEYTGEHPHPQATTMYTLMAIATGVAVVGIYGAYFMLWKRPEIAKGFVDRNQELYELVRDKYRVDEAYDAAVVQPLLALNVACGRFDNNVIDGAVNLSGTSTEKAAHFWGSFDNEVVDGAVNGVADGLMAAGSGVRRVQTGNIRTYIMLALIGAVLLFAVFAFVVIVPKWLS